MAAPSIILFYSGMLYAGIRLLGEKLKSQPQEKLETVSYVISGINDNLAGIIIAIVVSFFVIGYIFVLYKLPIILGKGNGGENT